MFCFGKKSKSRFDEISNKIHQMTYRADAVIADFIAVNGHHPEFLVLTKDEVTILHEYFSGRYIDEDSVKHRASNYSRWKSEPMFMGCKVLINPSE